MSNWRGKRAYQMALVAEANIVALQEETETIETSLVGSGTLSASYYVGYTGQNGPLYPDNIRGKIGAPGMSVVVSGFETNGDGGGGLYIWDESATTDDGGMIIVPSAVEGASTIGTTGACWKRINGGIVNVKWFGAKGNYNLFTETGTDDTDAILEAMATGEIVFFPRGIYYVPDGLDWTAGTQLMGAGSGDYTVGIISGLATNSDVSLLRMDGMPQRSIRGLGLTRGGTFSSTKAALEVKNSHDVLFYDVGVTKYGGGEAFAYGFSFSDTSYNIHLDGCKTQGCPTGLYANGAGHLVSYSSKFESSTIAGISTVDCNGVTIVGGNIESCTNIGIDIQGTGDDNQTTALILGTRFEVNGGANTHIRIGAEDHLVRGVSVVGCFLHQDASDSPTTLIDRTYALDYCQMGNFGGGIGEVNKIPNFWSMGEADMGVDSEIPSDSAVDGSVRLCTAGDGAAGLYVCTGSAWKKVLTED